MKIYFLFGILVLTSLTTYAQCFDDFLKSLDAHLPINTVHMQTVLKTHQTKLANPNILERIGVINQDAAASYHDVFNVITLKNEYTVGAGNSLRAKTWTELQVIEPVAWSIRVGTIFHELSHAEYDWMPKSKETVDRNVIKVLEYDLDVYLKQNQRNYSANERKIARSELFAYFRDDYITRTIAAIDDLLIENGYFKTSKTCRITPVFLSQLEKNPNLNVNEFVSFSADVDYTKSVLPVVYVKGKEAVISSKDSITGKLQTALWAQLDKHFSAAKSKYELIRWMNSQPELLALIQPCRQSLAAR